MSNNEVEIKSDYFYWLLSKIGYDRFSYRTSYMKLLKHLHRTRFTWSIKNDANRAAEGKELRHRFALATENEQNEDYILYILQGSCSVLEMMAALAIACEESIMDDPDKGDRTGQWFWGMINNLGLGSMNDDIYNEDKVTRILNRFLSRQYEPNGEGGLFRIRGCDKDLRKVEIWYQMCWYLDTLI